MMAGVFTRLALTGVFVSAKGVKIRASTETSTFTWFQVESFEICEHQAALGRPRRGVCLRLRNGGRVEAFGLCEKCGYKPRHTTIEQLIERLNAEREAML
jgi:hypothetical protein